VATLSFKYITENGASYSYSGEGTLTYSVSSTSDGTTVSVSSITIRNTQSGATVAKRYTYSVKVAGTVIASGGVSLATGKSMTISISGSKTVTRGHSASTATLAITGSGAGGTIQKPEVGGTVTASVSVPARPSYSVTYDANGGTGAPSGQTKWYGETLTLASAKPTRAGYVFYHWNTARNNGGTSYNPGGSYTGNAALALYAIWNPVVTYDANGGTGAPSSQTRTYGEALTLSTTRPTRAGYVFYHWSTSATDAGSTFQPGGTYNLDVSSTLHAIWNPVISFDANGGTGAPSSQTKTYGEALTLTTSKPTRTGYTFARWTTAPDGSGSAYASGGRYASNSSATLYAQWTKDPDPPTIASLSVVRCDSTGTPQDEGTHCKVTCAWSIDTTNLSGNTATVTGSIKPASGSARTITFSSGASGTGGTAVAVVPDCGTDTQYAVTVTVTDSRTSTSRTDILTRAKFIFDIRAGGDAMGIGSAAPEDGLEVGWPAQFDEDVAVLGDQSVAGSLTVSGKLSAPQLTVTSKSSDIVTSSSGWTVYSQEARTYGKVVMVLAGLKPTTAVAAGSISRIGTLKSGFRPALLQGFANRYGYGDIDSSGNITFRNDAALTTGPVVEVALTFIKP